MQVKIAALENLIHELTKLPGIGEKTAQRLAYFVLREGAQYTDALSNALQEVRDTVHLCSNCFAYTDQEKFCSTCESPERDAQSVCVVEAPSDIFRIETSGVFKGLYHVLHGSIAPLEGIRPEDLKINELIQRIEDSQSTDKPIREVIFALDADLEGDTTSLYLVKLLQPKGLKLTRIAYGIPFGADIDYIDRRTLGRALENRVEL
jgi:recombination protein RecR